MIFSEIISPPSETIPRWFEFERDCARFLRRRNLNVIHQSAERNVDGGVDLFAESSSGQTYIVQCKCWATHRRVGPEVMRELEGAIRYADMGTSGESKGIVITTSCFTSGAIEVGRALGYELIDGETFSALTSAIGKPGSLS
jgi:restriction endonuclease Mrr